MRVLASAVLVAGFFPVLSAAQDQIPSHPSEVAFVDEGIKGYVYRKFPTGERLYVSDKDTGGVSSCTGGCASAWPPVYASANAKPVGDWTLVRRDDGRAQWALKGRPIYLRFHDSPEIATGDGVDGVWHLVGHVQPDGQPRAQ